MSVLCFEFHRSSVNLYSDTCNICCRTFTYISCTTISQNASSEDKQLQYIYKVLGTPKPMGFTDFDALSLAPLYGRHIQVHAVMVAVYLITAFTIAILHVSCTCTQEDNSDCRSRAFRVFKEQCPPPLLQCYSFSHPQPLPQHAPASARTSAAVTDSSAVSLLDVRKVVSQSDTDYEGVVDLVRLSMQLTPQRRLPVDLLLQFALFRQPVAALTVTLAACNSV